jgi:hypothetical protein
MPDIPIPLVGPSNEGIHPKADCQRTINLYPVKIEREGEKARWHLQGCPGLSTFVTLTDTPIRGMYVFRSRPFVVAANKLIEVFSDGTTDEWGTIGTIRGRVSMCELGDDLVIGDGATFYAFNLGTGAITVITDAPQGRFCVAFNQRVLYLEAGSGRVYYSELNDATDVPALNFFTAENKPDDATVLQAAEDRIYIGGTDTIEEWFDAGDADNPFQRVREGIVHAGVLAEDTFLIADNGYFYVEQSTAGKGIVRRSAVRPQRISTAAVERFTETATRLSAYTYAEQGRIFYVLNADEGTWAFDLKDAEWHERAFLDTSDGSLDRARPEIHAFAFGKHLVSDYENGKIYEQSLSYYDHAGTAMISRRVTAATFADGAAVTVDEFFVDCATGVGLITGQGSDPQAMLRYSTDAGQNWSNELSRDIGAIGDTNARVRWHSLGLGRDWAFEVSISDPVPRVLIGARARVRVGRR